MSSALTLSAFVQNTAMGIVGREAFSVNVMCGNPRLALLIERRIKNFLENDSMFATEVADIAGHKTQTGVALIDFLIKEGMARSIPESRRIISNGNVRRKDQTGMWKIVATPEAQMRPGWWKVSRHGMVKIGDDYIIEKRYDGKTAFTKVVSR